jgi:hypothetical protein
MVLSFVRFFEICTQKPADDRVGMLFDFPGFTDGEDAPLVDDGEAIGHTEREIAVVRHHE